MKSFKITFMVLGAIFTALFIATLWAMVRDFNPQRQTGIGAVAGGVSGLLLSPVFWVLAPLFFFFFLRMSKVGNEAVRILFFLDTNGSGNQHRAPFCGGVDIPVSAF